MLEPMSFESLWPYVQLFFGPFMPVINALVILFMASVGWKFLREAFTRS